MKASSLCNMQVTEVWVCLCVVFFFFLRGGVDSGVWEKNCIVNLQTRLFIVSMDTSP